MLKTKFAVDVQTSHVFDQQNKHVAVIDSSLVFINTVWNPNFDRMATTLASIQFRVRGTPWNRCLYKTQDNKKY